jgi:hypothetical protein
MTTWTETNNYLADRGNRYGLSAQDLINQTPDLIQDDPAAILTFWQDKDISHVLPTSTHPHLADDATNIFPEDPSINRTRQDEPVSPLERFEAWADNQTDAIKAMLPWPF